MDSLLRRPCRLSSLLALPLAVSAQFGGAGFEPPPPICPAHKCKGDTVRAPKKDYQIWSYGCKDGGMNILSMADLGPDGMPRPKSGGKNLDKCCVERDICKQTCGMASKDCQEAFVKCKNKICKGDQNCNLQSIMADMSTDPPEKLMKAAGVAMDGPESYKCRGYEYHQKQACQCVPKADAQNVTEQRLQWFYSKFNPEKLDADGNIKDVEEVWKKWKGKEGDMFVALATKYKAKAVEIKPKPKYEPPGDFGADDLKDFGSAAAEEEPEAAKEDVPPPPKELDEDDEAFEKARRKLKIKQTEAAEDEHYDVAQSAKEEVEELVKKELERLKAKKTKAIDDEDFAEAKRLKKRLEKVEL
eukprot:TRINITY_DN75455_c0_g1_i1.p1 TRINITY_DN75455_c0_g1~~TRINITY_DN75455_c0_g1_i1.p1  ORF type:complete len:358 (+),score=140.33 TRINITY_DN75455_c0_g1_i1:85-1158(+)